MKCGSSSDYFDDDTNLAMLQVANIHDEVTECMLWQRDVGFSQFADMAWGFIAGLLTDAENSKFSRNKPPIGSDTRLCFPDLFLDAEEGDEVIPVLGDGSSVRLALFSSDCFLSQDAGRRIYAGLWRGVLGGR